MNETLFHDFKFSPLPHWKALIASLPPSRSPYYDTSMPSRAVIREAVSKDAAAFLQARGQPVDLAMKLTDQFVLWAFKTVELDDNVGSY